MMHLRMQFQLYIYTYIPTKLREQKLKISSRWITLSKKQPTITKFSLDLCIPLMYLHMQFQYLNTIHPNKSYRVETENFLKRISSVKNYLTRQFDLDVRIPLTYLQMQFQPYTYIQTKVTEQKLKILSRGITLSKIIGP
jgi:hypothetical protein